MDIKFRGSLAKGNPASRYEGKNYPTQYTYLKLRCLVDALNLEQRDRLAQAGLDGETIEVSLSFPDDATPQAQPPLPGLAPTPPPVEAGADTVTVCTGEGNVTVTAAQFARVAAAAGDAGYAEAQERHGWRKGEECIIPGGEIGIVHDFSADMVEVRTGQGIGELALFDPQDLRRREGK